LAGKALGAVCGTILALGEIPRTQDKLAVVRRHFRKVYSPAKKDLSCQPVQGENNLSRKKA